jgi:hypothetical protein
MRIASIGVMTLTLGTLATMAGAPPPPMTVKVAGAVTPDTVLSWSASPGLPAAGAFWGH